MKTSSFGALTITPRAFASSSAKQYPSPVFFPVLHESSRMFCLFQPSIWRMTDASRRGNIFGFFVPYPTAVGDPCMATSKNVFNGFTALIFTASWSSLGKTEKPFSKRIIPPVTIYSSHLGRLRRSFASLAYHLGWSEEETMRHGGWSD